MNFEGVIMDKIDSSQKIGYSELTFGLYFLDLFNLMFNWGHHMYTMTTEPYVRYIGYAVSMTEWVFLLKIIYSWKISVNQAKRLFHYFSYRFIIASETWVFLNLGLALLMSIPAFNLYTHGTHITVAHAMGTTIGINSMILMAAGFEFFTGWCFNLNKGNRLLKISFWTAQISLLVFWLSLILAGFAKGFWQMGERHESFTQMMQNLTPFFIVFIVSGFAFFLAISIPAFLLLKANIICRFTGISQEKTFEERLGNGVDFENNAGNEIESV